MNYEYMKEYPCNGEKPDLEDDVLVQIDTVSSKGFGWPAQVIRWDWGERILRFRIVDERWKPKSDEVQKNEFGEWVKTEVDKSDWFEAGDKCEVLLFGDDEWRPAKFFGCDPDDNSLIFKHLKGYSRVKSWRAPRTERDELVDEVATAIYKGISSGRTSQDIAIALYDAEMLKKPEEE